MLKKLRNGKGVKIILVVTMFGIGSVSYIPTTYAAMNQTDVTAASEQQNSLSKLEIDGVSLDQVFSPDSNVYTATVENSVQQITLHMESENTQAVIKVNGQTVTNGTSGPLALQTGENLFTITVDDSSHPASTYKLTVTRKQSSLSKLNIDGVSLDQVFSPNINEYTATVENSVQQITLHMESGNPQAVIKVNGQTVTNGTAGPLTLQTGENLFTITVDDGIYPASTYKLTVTRKQNSNNLLKNIKLSKGELSPEFNPTLEDYNVNVTNDVASLIITPEAFEKTSSIQINNKLFRDSDISVTLPEGKTEIKILVTAENGDKKTYTLHITRAQNQSHNPPASHGNPGSNSGGNKTKYPNNSSGTKNMTHSKQPAQSAGSGSNSSWKSGSTKQMGTQAAIQKINKATLSSLTVSNGSWNKAFTTSAYTYHLAESNSVKTVTINPGATYSSSTLTVAGSSSRTIQLNGSKTTVSVVVTNGEDRKTYVLVFEKKVPAAPVTTDSLVNTDSTVSGTSDSASVNNDSAVQTTAWNGSGRNKNTTTSFWSKIADSISTFFKNLF